MNKTLVVARNEYISAVTSKGFIIGVLMMPVFMGGAFVVQYLTRDQEDLADRKVAIVDHTGELFSAIAAQAEERNQTVLAPRNSNPPRQVWPKFIVEQYVPDVEVSEQPGVVLSQRVKQQELFGFIIIDSDAILADTGIEAALAYHTETLTYSALPNWLEQTVNTEIQRLRMKQLDVDPSTLAAVTERVRLRRFGLVELDADGNALAAREDEDHRILKYAVPLGGMMLMFMMVMSVAPAMLNTVLEEKMQKISEFLVSSVTPFQLMLGKLFAGVGVAFTLSLLYLGAVYGLVSYFGFQDRVPPTIYLWFMLFLLLALTIFGSMFSAIGAACSEIRDAQGLMTPIVLMLVIPMLSLGPVLTSPSSMFSRLISLVPPATPILMFVRIAIPPGPPVREVVLAIALTLAFAAGCVWAAGKVFRIGILSQGQTATMRRLFQWVLSSQ